MIKVSPEAFSASNITPEMSLLVLRDPALKQIEIISGKVSLVAPDQGEVKKGWEVDLRYSTNLRKFCLETVHYPQSLTQDLLVPGKFQIFTYMLPLAPSYNYSKNGSFRRGPEQGLNLSNEALAHLINPDGDLNVLLNNKYKIKAFQMGFEARETDDGSVNEGGVSYTSDNNCLAIHMGRVMVNSTFMNPQRVALIRSWYEELKTKL